MQTSVKSGIIVCLLLAAVVWADSAVQIAYQVDEISPDRWEYTYAVTNQGLTEPIEEFTIWFEEGLYNNLTITTSGPLETQWDEVVWQPEPLFNDAGGYDALALVTGIPLGQTVSGFSVRFDWLGTGLPGSQPFDVVDPENYQIPITSGTTVPEPCTVLLLLGGVAWLHRRNR
ncbi:MAG: hypothetical protein JW709_04025 [Sedimentisphaerales bacterium]|nr:hypothetical protein [Sedimentisphaerales bacterium]